MLVSIVTPSFNQGKYLPDLIGSVKAQTHRPIEHIVFDGRSTDATLNVLHSYEKNPGGIEVKWTSEKDRGQAHAVNKGFEMARGEVIGWLNSDDVYFHTGVIERVVKEFTAHPEVDVIYGNVAKISADNLLSLIWWIPGFNYQRMFIDGKISQPATFMRRRVIEENKLSEDVLALDYEYWLRLGKRYHFLRINDLFAGDRNQPERISRTQSAELRASHLAAQQEHQPAIPGLRKVWYRASSVPLRAIYRVLGLVAFINWQNHLDRCAFPIRTDSTMAFIKRQLFTRISDLPLGDRSDDETSENPA
jgi:glycosyltransferase involved in cell wall biosynthesis